MITLAWDSSGQSQAVAIAIGGEIRSESWTPAANSHSEILLPTLQKLLADAGVGLPQVDLFAVTVGPGSFTGLRIGIATLKAFCRVSDRPVAAVSTLTALEEPLISSERRVVACLDARLGQVFTASPACEAAVTIEAFAASLEGFAGETWVVGSGALLYRQRLEKIPGVQVPAEGRLHHIQGGAVLRLGEQLFRGGKTLSGREMIPRYLRATEAENRLAAAQK